MSLFDFFKNFGKQEEEFTGKPKSSIIDSYGAVNYNPIIDDVFDGEKTPGELGAIYDTVPEHLKLRLRAYDMHLKTDIIKIITGKFFKWVIGSGLKLQAEPNETVLNLKNINEDLPMFQKNVEALFNLYSGSKYSDYHRRDWLHEKAKEAFSTSFLGGDCLCIIRVDDAGPNIQVIDGQQISTPLEEKAEDGNVIRDGIEMNSRGEHIAFWVTKSKRDVLDDDMLLEIDYERISAVDSQGNLVAWMVYGMKARIDHHRGIPVITSILEKVAKLDRFVEASVTKAEQTANVVYAFKHNENSTGENIIAASLSSRVTDDETNETTFEKNGRTANMLRQSTSGTVMNLTPDSDLISLHAPSETTFNEFFRAIFTTLCAAVDIPEEVALQKYEQNYSSSRAAINGWEYIVEIYRQKFAKKFYEPFYRVWLQHQIYDNQIKSDGFLKSQNKGDFMALEAFYSARFTGKKMPHIDPLKETKAIRSMLGDNETPLISFEQATEILNGGNWNENYKKFIKEDKIIIKDESTENENNNRN